MTAIPPAVYGGRYRTSRGLQGVESLSSCSDVTARSRRLLPRNLSGTALRVEFSTVHSAKGREEDYAVVLDLKDDRFGFPSKVGDDPLLELVLPPASGRAYPFAEERRLFYVAMTRARVGTYLVTDSRRPSPFVEELQQSPGTLRHLDMHAGSGG